MSLTVSHPTVQIEHLSEKSSLPVSVHIEDVKTIDSINDLIVDRAETIPTKSLLAYPATDSDPANWVYYTAKDLDDGADEAAWQYTGLGLQPADDNGNESEVVALLGPSDFNYIISMFGLTRMGFSVMFLSTRLPIEAYVSLLQQAKCRKVISTPQFASVVEQVAEQHDLASFPLLNFRVKGGNPPHRGRFQRSVQIADEASRIAFIVHSSGSTGLPKPIFQTHRSCLANYAVGSGKRAFVTLPLFHNHGLSTFHRGIFSGVTTAFFNASLPMTHDNLLQAIEPFGPESFNCVPYALKLLAESDRGIEALKKCKLVLFGGSSCPDDLGDKLVDAGVYLVGHYGATEMGQLMNSFRDPSDKAWNYVRPFPAAAPFLRFVPAGNGTYELIVLDGLPSKVLSNSDDPPNSYHTRDEFIPHATIPNAWKYLGRLDDRVTLFNGEKVLPIPFEHRLRQHPLVEEALIFGAGKGIPGLLIFRSEEAQALSKSELLERLAPEIAAANERAEKFGRVALDMVEILDYGTPYPRTDKGTIIRAKSYKVFEELIESIYTRFETYDEARDGARQVLDVDQLAAYLLDLFANTVGVQGLEEHTDFFEAGIDSLQSVLARAKIVRDIDLGSTAPGQNVVYEHPTVRKLAQYLYFLRTGEGFEQDDETALMADLIQKYSSFPEFIPGTKEPEGEVILLTGATGYLGAHILSQLVALENVRRVYCLVRADSVDAAQDRIADSLQSRALSSAAKTDKIVSLPSDLGREDLGLAPEMLEEIMSNLTHVIHSAWAVNFNLGVGSFERAHIGGTHNLLKLCLRVPFQRPAKLFFVSSISAAAGTPMPATINEGHVEDLAHAQNLGYARSKLVTEHILRAAARSTGMDAQVLRTGQIIGDSKNGLWNPTEAIPLIFQSATTLGVLPKLDETPSWLPVDTCASAIVELSGLHPSSAGIQYDADTVYHVQNHRVFSWTNEILPALQAAGLEFEAVGQREWVRRLRESEPDPAKNPTIKLVDFFTEKYDHDRPGRAGLAFRTERTAHDSAVIAAGFDVVGSDILKKCVESWKAGPWNINNQ